MSDDRPNAPLSHIAPVLNCSHCGLSISTLSLATVLLLLPSAPGCTSRLHCVSLYGLHGLPWSLTTPARVRSHILLLSPPWSVRSARSLSPLSVHHVSGSVDLYYCNVPAWPFLTSLMENENPNIQLTLASNQMTALTTTVMMMTKG